MAGQHRAGQGSTGQEEQERELLPGVPGLWLPPLAVARLAGWTSMDDGPCCDGLSYCGSLLPARYLGTWPPEVRGYTAH